jgi:hypothetical protein
LLQLGTICAQYLQDYLCYGKRLDLAKIMNSSEGKVQVRQNPKSGGETLVRINLGEKTPLVSLFLFFPVCAVFMATFKKIHPHFCQKKGPITTPPPPPSPPFGDQFQKESP